jgi:hypothetical protein
VYNRLETLRHAGVVRLLHDGTRLFEFVEDPRERGVE